MFIQLIREQCTLKKVGLTFYTFYTLLGLYLPFSITRLRIYLKHQQSSVFFLKNINSRGCELSLCTSIFKFSSSIHNSENLTFFILWHTYIYKNQGVRNVDFSKHFVCLTFRLDWDVCLIVLLLSSNYIPINTQAALNLHRISFDFQQFFTRQYNIILNFEKLF